MSNSRERALKEAASHKANRFYSEEGPVSEYFAQNVFDQAKMEKYLSPKAYAAVMQAVRGESKLDVSVADEIAQGMMKWAMEKGVTHYTHIFQPLNDATAEKHESFIGQVDGRIVERFSGKALVQQEPDASSFPSGGLRNTFEARGYSAWDPSSPVFILDGTLCIPSVFVSYTGESLDTKVPTLKSLKALDDAATDLMHYFDPDVKGVQVNLGLEQEYFIVDESLYNARPDLVLCGRTVIGHTSAKDQQLDDHYFGAIPSQVSAFMKDFETEAYKLGVLLQTRHNEVAPNQFECAPLFCEAVKAIDQNMMLMIVMQKVAKKHNLKVVFHEKPFDGVNGSGKHCNWSMSTKDGRNLLSPGKTPENNLQFLSFFSCVVKAVHRHHFLLMASTASLNNSYRLGGNEAPPTVMSVFSGTTLYDVFNSIRTMQEPSSKAGKHESIKIVNSVPEIFPDNTDRNRTSPFAFTGNRFEFRALGSSVNVANTVFVLNTVVAQAMREFKQRADALIASGTDKDTAIMQILREFSIESQDILFEGNGYSKEWHQEAERRGLKALGNVPDAYDIYQDADVQQMFESLGVLRPNELTARREILNETYVKKLQIESRVIVDLCSNHVIPAAEKYKEILCRNIARMKDVFPDEWQTLCESEINIVKKISGYVNLLNENCRLMVRMRREANKIEDIPQRAKVYSHEIMDKMWEIRRSADKLELYIDDELWPMPKYRELMFL